MGDTEVYQLKVSISNALLYFEREQETGYTLTKDELLNTNYRSGSLHKNTRNYIQKICIRLVYKYITVLFGKSLYLLDKTLSGELILTNFQFINQFMYLQK